MTPSAFHYPSSQFWCLFTTNLWPSPLETSLVCPVIGIHVLVSSPWIPISAAKVYEQHEVHKASLEIACICYQLFVAESFRKVDCLGEDESSVFNIHNLLWAHTWIHTYVCQHPPESDGCVPFWFLRHISSVPESLKHCYSFFYK